MADQIDIIVADLDRFTRREIIALAVNIDANLRDNPPVGTPVDTGWARANWVPNVGEAKILKADDKEVTAAMIAARQAEAEQGLNRVLAWKIADGPIFNTNSVPYIKPLNDGHSPQSPPGFIQAAIEKGVRDTYSRGASQAARSRRADAARANKPRPLK